MLKNRIYLEVVCPAHNRGDTTVEVILEPTPDGDLILPVNICNQGCGADICQKCTYLIWKFFKEHPQLVNQNSLFLRSIDPLNLPKI